MDSNVIGIASFLYIIADLDKTVRAIDEPAHVYIRTENWTNVIKIRLIIFLNK